MRRVRLAQPVRLDIASIPMSVRCIVAAKGEDDLALAPIDAIDPHLLGMLVATSSAYLLFEHGAHPVGLRGTVVRRQADGRFVFAVADEAALTERRAHARRTLALAARLRAVGDEGEGVPVTTVDVGTGGVRIARTSGIAGDGPWAIELELAPGERPLATHAELVRRDTTSLALRFATLSQDDAERLSARLA